MYALLYLRIFFFVFAQAAMVGLECAGSFSFLSNDLEDRHDCYYGDDYRD